MANKKSKKKNQLKTSVNRDAKKTRTLQIAFVLFSAILVLSMILSLAAK